MSQPTNLLNFSNTPIQGSDFQRLVQNKKTTKVSLCLTNKVWRASIQSRGPEVWITARTTICSN